MYIHKTTTPNALLHGGGFFMLLAFAAKSENFRRKNHSLEKQFLPNKEGNAGHVFHRAQGRISVLCM